MSVFRFAVQGRSVKTRRVGIALSEVPSRQRKGEQSKKAREGSRVKNEPAKI